MQLDQDGFLANHTDWTPEIAEQLAGQSGLTLTPAHWEILYAIRDFYTQFGLSPINRALVKYIGQRFGPEKGQSVYLLTLFPGGPAKLACKLAGLPKPHNCL